VEEEEDTVGVTVLNFEFHMSRNCPSVLVDPTIGGDNDDVSAAALGKERDTLPSLRSEICLPK